MYYGTTTTVALLTCVWKIKTKGSSCVKYHKSAA